MSDSAGNKNKRKALNDDDPMEEVPSDPMSLSEKFIEELKLNVQEWDDPLVQQLLEVLFNHLKVFLEGAVKKIVDKGYTKESAEQLLFKSGLYHGLKDVMSNAVDGALAFAKKGKTCGQVFQDIDKMVEFCLLEMVNVVRHTKPDCAGVIDAMWSLLACDLNLMYALALNKDELGCHSVQDLFGDTVSDDKERFQETFYSGHISKLLEAKRNPVEWAGAAVKADMSARQKGSLYRDRLRHMLLCSGKDHKGHMCKVCPAGTNSLDKVLKFSPGYSPVVMKSRFVKHGSRLGATTPVPDTCGMSDTHSPLPVVDNKVSASLSLNSKSADGESMGTCVIPTPCEMEALNREHQRLTNWSNEKVIQATRRLAKEQTELKMLRQKKKEWDHLSQTTEDIRKKRLNDIDQALSNAAMQLKNARLDYNKANDEHNVLKNELCVANSKSDKSIYELCESSKENKETLNYVRSADMHKVSYQDKLAALRDGKAGHLSQLKISRDREEQHEVLRRHAEVQKLKYYEDSLRKTSETEKKKVQAKANIERMRETAERFTQKCKEEIKNLDAEITKLRSLAVSPKPLDVHEIGGPSGFSSTSLVNLTASSSKVVEAAKRLPVFQEICGGKDIMEVEGERECIMCLSEDTCVFFIPCAHQVLCSECNDIHEKQGMSDCPSCRKPIQARISVEYVDAWQL